MKSDQKQSLESFVRVRGFLDAHPVPGPLSYGDALVTLDDAMARIRTYAGTQLTGRDLGRGEVRRQQQLIQQLLDRHMRPIVTVAKAQIEPGSDVRMPAALRMPRNGIGVTRVLQASDGMIEAARPFEATLIAHGLPADFLARFTAARDALEQQSGGRVAHLTAHVAARAGLAVQFRRGRRAVARLDAIVRASFDDEATLASWRAARRVRAVRVTDPDPQPAAQEPVEVVRAA